MGQLTVILILLAVQIVTFLYFRMHIRRELSRENRIDSVRREIEQLIIELDRTTDRNIELIEDRINKLKESVKKGERVIRLIESEQEKRDNSPALYNDLRSRITTRDILQEEPHEILRESSRQKDSGEISPPEEIIIGVTPPEQSLDIEVVDGRERALELYRQGMEPALIASATGLPRGEVELIISLESKGN